MGSENRPYKYGPKDRREFIVQNSEVALRAVNDANGNPIYLARAKLGVADADEKWQIRKITYDASQGVTAVEWAESGTVASADFIFSWADYLTYSYS